MNKTISHSAPNGVGKALEAEGRATRGGAEPAEFQKAGVAAGGQSGDETGARKMPGHFLSNDT